jgi:hypothetical protein
MVQRPKAKPKRKSPSATKGSDEKQSARFIETARRLMADEEGKNFDIAIEKILPQRKAKKR